MFQFPLLRKIKQFLYISKEKAGCLFRLLSFASIFRTIYLLFYMYVFIATFALVSLHRS